MADNPTGRPLWSRNQRTACRRCHARKVRCDAPAPGQPCSGCLSSGTPCIAHEKRRRNRGPSRPSMPMPTLLPSPSVSSRSSIVVEPTRSTPQKRPSTHQAPSHSPPTFNKTEWNESEVSDHAGSASQRSLTAVAGSPTVHRPRAPNNEEVGRAAAVLSSLSANKTYDGPDDGDVDDGPGDGDNNSTPTDITHHVDADGAKSHLVEMLTQEDMEDRVMQRGVRIVYVGQEYSNIHYLIRQRARRASSALVHHFPSNQIARRYTSHELDRIPREAFTLPPKAIVDALLSAYFKHVHPGFPVLDKAAFMGQYRRRDPQNPLSLLVLQAVLMVGAHVWGGDDGDDNIGADPDVAAALQDRAALKAAFFRRAKMLFDARFEWNRDVVVQAALLLMWHSEGVEDIGANSYYWVGVAARTALGLGMHRDTRASTLVATDKRLWRRLWWMLVQLDGIVTLSYGRPPAIRLDESDVPELTEEELTETDDGEDSGIDVPYMIHQMRLSCIVARTLRDRFGLQVPPERRRQALVDADQQLALWMARLPTSTAASSSPWATMLHLTYNNVLILLHRPLPSSCTDSPTGGSQESMGICSAAAGAVVSLLEAAVARCQLRFLNVFAVDALLTTLIQLSAEIRMANPILAGHARQRFDAAMDILRKLAGIWLHAEIVLRLFEDRSERARLLGKCANTVLVHGQSVGPPTTSLDVPPAYSPHPSQHPATPGSTLPMDSFQPLLISSTGLPPQQPHNQQHQQHQQHQYSQSQLVPMNDHLDWTNLYWENGLASLSPFSDMPMYLSL